jgi:hypothetical protein
MFVFLGDDIILWWAGLPLFQISISSEDGNGCFYGSFGKAAYQNMISKLKTGN